MRTQIRNLTCTSRAQAVSGSKSIPLKRVQLCSYLLANPFAAYVLTANVFVGEIPTSSLALDYGHKVVYLPSTYTQTVSDSECRRVCN